MKKSILMLLFLAVVAGWYIMVMDKDTGSSQQHDVNIPASLSDDFKSKPVVGDASIAEHSDTSPSDQSQHKQKSAQSLLDATSRTADASSDMSQPDRSVASANLAEGEIKLEVNDSQVDKDAGRAGREAGSVDAIANPGDIGGRVLDNNGFALPASVVTARPVDASQGRITDEVMADSEGWFMFSGLQDGNYVLQATDPVSSNSSQAVRVATGTDIVDLVVPVIQKLVLFGAVTELDGDPLPGASIRLLPAGADTTTDDLGVYLLEVDLRRGLGQTLVVEKPDYEPVKKPVSQQQWQANPELQVDVQLRPNAQTTTVAGAVIDDHGDPVSGQNMQLNNVSYRYKTTTNQAGRFLFNDVAVGNNYHLNVLTDIGYERYQRSGLSIPPEGISDMQINVVKRGFGEVSGTFFSATGERLSGYTSNIVIAGHRIPVTSGNDGAFRVEHVPAGSISISDAGRGSVTTSGAEVIADESISVNVLVDVGAQQFVGRVQDESGQPVGGAKILWRWQSREHGLLHESMRNAVSDSNGRFALSGFADVAHELRITAPGHPSLQTMVSAGQNTGEYTLQ